MNEYVEITQKKSYSNGLYKLDLLLNKDKHKLLLNDEYSALAIEFFEMGYDNKDKPKFNSSLTQEHKAHLNFLYTEGKKINEYHNKFSENNKRYSYWYFSRNGKMVNEQRWVKQLILGRKLKCNEFVTHRDGNTKNNKPTNLEIKSGTMRRNNRKSQRSIDIPKDTIIDESVLKNLYYSGYAVKDIAIHLNLTPKVTRCALHRLGIKKLKGHYRSIVPIQEVIDLYKAGFSGIEIAKKFNCNVGIIYRRLRTSGIRIRTSGSSHRLVNARKEVI